MSEKILIASDHGGYDLKTKILDSPWPGLEFVDLGCHDTKSVDYPDYAKKLCQELLKQNHSSSRGILICGTGQGMAIQANRFKGIRAALCWNEDVAKLSRDHNNTNVLCLGARVLNPTSALDIVKVWLTTPFSGGRHLDRITKIDSSLS